jgi:uncharacterized protein (UPF0276 family)
LARLSPSSLPFLGAGLGYRRALHDLLRRKRREVGFIEVMPEHVLEGTATARAALVDFAATMPCVTHSVSLSVGTATGADLAFAARMAKVSDRLDAAWASDHLCYTKVGDRHIGQLTPIPYTDEALRIVVANVKAVQATMGDRPFLLENISRYFQFEGTDFTEPEFFTAVTKRTGCGVLLDVTNLHNNATNLGLDPSRYLREFPLDAVVQLHLAGSEWVGGKLLDTHGGPVLDPVWDLMTQVVTEGNVRAALIERDQTFELGDLLAEVRRANSIFAKSRRR